MDNNTFNTPPEAQKQLVDISSFFVNTVTFFQKYKFIFLAVSLLSIAFGFLKYKTDDKIYVSKLTAETFSLGDTRIIDLMNVLQQYVEYGDYAALSKSLSLTKAEASQLTSINAGTNYEIEKKVKGSQMFVDDQPKQVFFIEVKVKDTSMLNELQQGLIKYISNTPLSLVRIKSIRNALDIYINQIDKQIQRSDSITDILVANQMKGKGGNLTIDFGAAIEGTAKAALDRFDMIKQYSNAQEVNVIVPFAKYSKPESPRLLVSLFVFILPANILALLILIGIEANKSKK